uniref:Peroxisomal membrane protein PEX14 n=1 Tax=Evadne anonyx TaxID=141404 RepID=A0A9N6WSA4_9CRUS|nr:EOG090X0FQ8 [Evadne anonyx]
MSETTTQEVEDLPQTLRDDLISTAVKFLQNPRVTSRPSSDKEKFLRGKGLNDAEITAAFKAAGTTSIQQDNSHGHYSSLKVAQVHEYCGSMIPASNSRWGVIRDVLNTVVLLAGAAYSLQYLFKYFNEISANMRFIAPLLFGRPKKEKTVGDRVSEMNANITQLVSDIKSLSDSVAVLHSKQTEKADVKLLKSEIASLKALMLSRRQFPATPSIGATPTIPAWQLASDNDKRTGMLSSDVLHHQDNGGGTSISLSSSPEIISVEEIPSSNPNMNLNSLTSRVSSESSEAGSAEIVEMGIGASGEDTD